MTGHSNGSGKAKVASLDEARRRAAAKAKAERRPESARGERSVRDFVIGGTIIAMALGFLASLVLPLVKG